MMRVVALLMFVFVASCTRGERQPGPSDTTSSMFEAGAADTAQPAAPLTDSHVLALLDHSNFADSTTGAIAASKSTSSELRAFARQMVRDHRALRVEGERVARRLRLTPTLPDGDESESELASTVELLLSTARGRDFDKAYIDYEVAYHLDVLETAVTAMQMVRETELRAYIQQLAPMFQQHYDRAKALQALMR